MNVLLDTHVALWLLDGGGRITPANIKFLEGVERRFVSIVSAWEVGIKHRFGRLKLSPAQFVAGCSRSGMGQLALEQAHLDGLAALPMHADHRDPFDHLLFAQARAEGFVIVSADRHAGSYGIDHLDPTAAR